MHAGVELNDLTKMGKQVRQYVRVCVTETGGTIAGWQLCVKINKKKK